MKLCLIGCGGMAQSGQGPAFKKCTEENKSIKLSACCDIDEMKAKKFKEMFGFKKYYLDYNEMLETESPDAVSLICPVKNTKELALNIINKKYPLILEKPPGRNKSELKELIVAAKENNVLVKVAFNRRYTPLIKELREKINNKKIYHINHNMLRYRRFEKDFTTTAIHAIDTVKFLANSNYKKICFTYQSLPEYGENVTNIFLNCIFENGMIANLNFVVAAGGIVENIIVNCLDETYILNVPLFNAYDFPGKIVGIREKKQYIDAKGNEFMENFELSGFYNENKEFLDLVKVGEIGYIDDLESSIQSVIIADLIRNRTPEFEF